MTACRFDRCWAAAGSRRCFAWNCPDDSATRWRPACPTAWFDRPFLRRTLLRRPGLFRGFGNIARLTAGRAGAFFVGGDAAIVRRGGRAGRALAGALVFVTAACAALSLAIALGLARRFRFVCTVAGRFRVIGRIRWFARITGLVAAVLRIDLRLRRTSAVAAGFIARLCRIFLILIRFGHVSRLAGLGAVFGRRAAVRFRLVSAAGFWLLFAARAAARLLLLRLLLRFLAAAALGIARPRLRLGRLAGVFCIAFGHGGIALRRTLLLFPFVGLGVAFSQLLVLAALAIGPLLLRIRRIAIGRLIAFFAAAHFLLGSLRPARWRVFLIALGPGLLAIGLVLRAGIRGFVIGSRGGLRLVIALAAGVLFRIPLIARLGSVLRLRSDVWLLRIAAWLRRLLVVGLECRDWIAGQANCRSASCPCSPACRRLVDCRPIGRDYSFRPVALAFADRVCDSWPEGWALFCSCSFCCCFSSFFTRSFMASAGWSFGLPVCLL